MIKRVTCNACGGTTFSVSNGARKSCWKCNGLGYFDNLVRPCNRCHGIGKIITGTDPLKCPTCDGTGEVTESR